MGFKVSQSTSYFWPVTIETPVDGGRYHKDTFDAEFKRMPQGRIEEIMKQALEGEVRDRDVANEVLVGWKGILDDSNQEIPYSIAQRDELFEIPGFATATIKAWMESLSGAKRKN